MTNEWDPVHCAKFKRKNVPGRRILSARFLRQKKERKKFGMLTEHKETM